MSDLLASRQEVTIFLPLSGRAEAWQEMKKFLDGQLIDRRSCLLCLLVTSHSSEFQEDVRNWLAGSSYPNVQYIQKKVGQDGLADIRRVREDASSDRRLHWDIQVAMCEIYSTMRQVVQTPLTWIIEDDVIPPLDAYASLLEALCPKTVSVSGAYQHRYKPTKVVAWGRDSALLEDGEGIEEIGGNGFGCVLMRTSLIKHHVLLPSKRWPDFDRAFYSRLAPDELVKLNWSVRCEHLSPTYELEPCPHPYEGYITEENFSESFYLAEHPDVRQAIEEGIFKNGFDHYSQFGRDEKRAARPTLEFDEDYYLGLYPDVKEAVEKGVVASGCRHYLSSGRKEGRYSRPKGVITDPRESDFLENGK